MAEARAIKRLLKALESIKAQVNTFTASTRISDIKTCITLLADEWKEYQALERVVKGKFDDTHSDAVDSIEAIHLELKHKLIKWEKLYEENNAHQNNCSMDELMLNQNSFLQQLSMLSNRESEVRLPRVNIPEFSGIYSEFPSFRDLFEASIHNNDKIPKVHKLQYLKGLLKGETYSIINHIAVTDVNYDEAWDKIKARYDKRKHVVHTLLKRFMEQPNLQEGCPKSLRHLCDVSDEIMRGLKVLGKDAEGRDPWLIHILVNKLDPHSKEAWAHITADMDFPTLNQLFSFLNKRSDALESLSSMQNPKPNITRRINSLVSQSMDNVCPLCSEEHYLGRCNKYLALPVQDRRRLITEKSLCFNCLSLNHHSAACRSRYNCKICRRRHHLTLHPESTDEIHIETRSESADPGIQSESIAQNAVLRMRSPQHIQMQAILPTAIVLIKGKFGEVHKCRVLLDSGSQSSFVSENCAQRLQLQRHTANVRITGVTTGSIISKGKTVITITSIYDSKTQIELDALIINNLPSKLPTYNIDCEDKSLFQNMQLADPDFDIPAPVDILIGADRFFSILENEQRQVNSTILQKTIFGWIVSGQPQLQQNGNLSLYMTFNIQLDIDIDSRLRKFWEIEEIAQAKDQSPEDSKCERFFTQTHARQEDGRYVVRLPFTNTSLKIGNSLIGATQRFLTLERKLSNNSELREQYINQMREYLELGHMIELPQTYQTLRDECLFYLPHHSVLKEDSSSTKMRIVFDGSSKTNTGISLNDKLMIGPTIQPTLWAILVKFRGHRIALTADIEKMYRQVIVSSEDSDFQRILWRENAIRSLQQLARDNGDEDIAQHIFNDFYVDDLLSGSYDEANAYKLKQRLQSVLQVGGFTLRKWQSNVQSLREEGNSKADLCSDDASTIKILGLQWHPRDDILTSKVKSEQNGRITKRKIISESSRVFDPLGFLSPSIVLLKILFQRLWFLKIDWDDRLPDCFEREYKKIRSEFEYFKEIKIERFTDHYESVELHGFADSSEDAYCAVVYSRITDAKGTISTSLLTSKTKVAPIKKISLPRLELCAAHLLAELMYLIKETIAPTAKCYAWTDSTIVLAWLSSYPAKWKSFVANRTSQILKKFPRQQWAHVKSSDNPADHGSRGVYPKRLVNLNQWWHGPEWLRKAENSWPSTLPSCVSTDNDIKLELRKNQSTAQSYPATIEEDWIAKIFERKSILRKILRIIAYVKRFVENMKARDPRKRNNDELRSTEIENAKVICILWIQRCEYSEEISNLRQSQVLNKSSKLLPLAPFIDSTGILRVGGRLFNADCSFNSKHPAIIPANHVFTERLIWETHNKNLHAGPTLTNNLIRQKYWIINGRTRIRSVLKNCVICAKYARKTSTQLMGNLPVERVTPTRPFTNCGIDFAGPLYFATKKERGGTNPVKGYLCIFVCFSVKAVHIEPVSDLTSEAFLAALRRFTARRGMPSKIYSDNGSNFIGARRILSNAHKMIQNINSNYVISEYLSDNSIDWHFIPPVSPHFGGLWESTVKSVKTHLLKSTNHVNLTFEEIATLLCQVENILNSRPLCTTSSDDDYEVLTPAHFLLGTSTGSVPETAITSTDSSLSRWQRIQARTQLFWKKYYQDYLNNLQQRRKWQKSMKNVEIGDIVLIKEDNTPVCKWPLGRVIEVHSGNDQLVRVVTIKTSTSTLQRPLTQICKLPIGER